MKTGCILLAAGAGVRFGGQKLKAQIAGKPLIKYILNTLPLESFADCRIVAADDELLRIAALSGIPGVVNRCPELGVARSIRMGLLSLAPVDACMFSVCDQPLLEAQTIAGMVASYIPGSILCLSSGDKRGNPVIFPSSLFDELGSLSKNESGKTVMAAHPALVSLYNIPDSAQLLDADTQAQLNQIEALLLSRSKTAL